MKLRLVIDVNLSPRWVAVFEQQGWSAVHWSTIGDLRASDRTIMDWAQANQYVVFTHDLDFGTLLALTRAEGPSVIQVRAQDVLPEHLGDIVVSAVRRHEGALAAGALVVVDEHSLRARVLPLLP